MEPRTPIGAGPRPTGEVEIADSELVRRSQHGDRDAFGHLVNRYMQRAYFGALGLVGSHDDALDLSQDAFVRAYDARARIDPDRPFFAWFYQILRRLCYNLVRDRRTRVQSFERATPWLRMNESDRAGANDPGLRLERDELRRTIEQELSELSTADREVIVLKEFHGLRYREIAELLDVPIGTVMSRLYSARRRLAVRLEKLL